LEGGERKRRDGRGVGKGKMSLEEEERKEKGWRGGGEEGRNEVGRGRKKKE